MIAEEEVALGATVRPDQTFFPEVLTAMIFMLFLFLVYFYWRECIKQITRIRNYNGFHDTNQMTFRESLNLIYLKHLAEGDSEPECKRTIKNIIAEWVLYMYNRYQEDIRSLISFVFVSGSNIWVEPEWRIEWKKRELMYY